MEDNIHLTSISNDFQEFEVAAFAPPLFLRMALRPEDASPRLTAHSDGSAGTRVKALIRAEPAIDSQLVADQMSHSGPKRSCFHLIVAELA